MKNTLFITLFILLFASTGWCLVIKVDDTYAGPKNGADVGNIDTFLAATDDLDNSNPTTETNWVNSILNSTTVTFSTKEEEDVPYYDTTSGSVFAYYLDAPPVSEYFLLKNAHYWALFENLADMSWAVFDSDLLPSPMNLSGDDYTISHVSRFEAETNVVPEPSTLLLLGAGLAGLAVYRRKKS